MKVKERTAIINSLHHNLTFASDSEVNAHLLNAYWNYEYLFEDEVDNIRSFNAIIDRWSEIVNKMKAVEDDPDNEYHPLWNIDYTEHSEGNRKTENESDSEGHQLPDGWKTKTTIAPVNSSENTDVSNSGYNSDTLTKTAGTTTGGRVSHEGSDEVEQLGDFKTTGHATGKGEDEHKDTITKQGNYGMTSSQDLFIQEMEKLRDYGNFLDWYCDKFAKCFDIKILDWSKIVW